MFSIYGPALAHFNYQQHKLALCAGNECESSSFTTNKHHMWINSTNVGKRFAHNSFLIEYIFCAFGSLLFVTYFLKKVKPTCSLVLVLFPLEKKQVKFPIRIRENKSQYWKFWDLKKPKFLFWLKKQNMFHRNIPLKQKIKASVSEKLWEPLFYASKMKSKRSFVSSKEGHSKTPPPCCAWSFLGNVSDTSKILFCDCPLGIQSNAFPPPSIPKTYWHFTTHGQVAYFHVRMLF